MTQAEWIATGFPGCEPAFPVAKDEPRAVDEGFVIVEPDEVKTKVQPLKTKANQLRQAESDEWDFRPGGIAALKMIVNAVMSSS